MIEVGSKRNSKKGDKLFLIQVNLYTNILKTKTQKEEVLVSVKRFRMS